MTTDQIILFAIMGSVLALLVWGRIRYDLVAFSALALAVNQAGGASVNTVVLMTVAEVDEAAKQAIAYRPPGG